MNTSLSETSNLKIQKQ